MKLHKLLALLLMAVMLCTAFDADAKRRKRKHRKRPKVTRVVMKTPTASGPLQETDPFITFERPTPITKGLDNRVIAVWQSHGKYYDQGQTQWRWQRPRLFGTVEDLLAQGFVLPYLIPMLENAGAYVMSPRERDLSTYELIIDTDGWKGGDFYMTNGRHHWKETSQGGGFAHKGGTITDGENPFTSGTSETVETVDSEDTDRQSTANWTADIKQRGRYAVYVSYRSYPNSATDARYTVNHLGGSTEITVNQQMGGGTWIYLGHFDLAEGKPSRPIVTLTNVSDEDDSVVSADAVKIGGGMGNVARAPKSCGRESLPAEVSCGPRFTEGARYWLQWAGMPPKVYTESDGTNDYTDDYKCRALWVNYLAGGSPMLPDSTGLNIPVDMALAFHTDAGTTDDGSVVGTLGIYSTDSGNLLGDGRTRLDARDLTETVIDQVVADVRALHNPGWTSRGVRDRKYYEIRETKVPAMIIETLSHQNFDDMKFALDPAFRFDVARAVYKGVLRFLARRYNTRCTVQPLPPSTFAIRDKGHGCYALSWTPTPDPLEPSAFSKNYIVQQRTDNGAFRDVAVVSEPHYETTITDNRIHSFRIVATNDGGMSFPSEVLALCNMGAGKTAVNIVNGFTRISAPDTFSTTEFSGFNYNADGGVPDVCDIITTGSQYDFRPASSYISNEAPGFGASRGNLEKIITAGNTRDFTYLHGLSIKAAGYGFVSESVAAFASEPTLNPLGAAGKPKVVDLILGKQKEIAPGNGSRGTRFKSFPRELQQRLEAHCMQGGALFVSGAFIATDLLDNPHSDETTRQLDRDFANNLLGFDWQLGKGTVDGKVSMVPSPFKPFGWQERFSFAVTPTPESYAVESPDAIRPTGTGASTIMRYDENGLSAGVAFDRAFNTNRGTGSYRSVAMGFPFETIESQKSRNRLMADILHFLIP